MINAQIGMLIKGEYTFTATSEARGSRELGVARSPNLIVNSGLNRLGGSGVVMNTCLVGSGSTTPAATDTALAVPVASTTTIVGGTGGTTTYVAGSPDYVQMITTYRFAEGVAAGNLSEVGVGWGTGSALFSRALILDGGGSPTTLTILSDETLDVTYTIRVYPPTTDVTGSITLDGVSYGYTIRPCNVSTSGTGSYYWDLSYIFSSSSINPMRIGYRSYTYAAGATIGARTALPSGTSTLTDITVTTLTYVPGEFKCRSTMKFELANGNAAGGISAIAFGFGRFSNTYNGCAFQIVFDSPVPKDATKTLRLTFDLTWANAA